MQEELLILGNGFDLQAGLDSKYRDFLDSTESQSSKNLWIEIIEKGNIANVRGLNWSDVENVIEEILTTFSVHILNHLIYQLIDEDITQQRLRVEQNNRDIRSMNDPDDIAELAIEIDNQQDLISLYEEIKKKLSIDNKVYNYSKVEELFWDENERMYMNDLKFYRDIAKSIKDKNPEINRMIIDTLTRHENFSAMPDLSKMHTDILPKLLIKLDSLFSKELGEFEQLFGDYLVKSVDTNSEYQTNSQELLRKILGVTTYMPIHILSFNYTNPFINVPASISNVHGTLNKKNIIFGVDLTNYMKDTGLEREEKDKILERLIPFSKTFRKMTIDTPDTWSLPKKPAHVRVYGHSLSSADYSYFQSVFDYINLYDSNVILEFCFSVHGDFSAAGEDIEQRKKLEEESRVPLKNEEAVKAYNLINIYGSTLNNKDQGHNLLHKLLVENRLKIREIQ